MKLERMMLSQGKEVWIKNLNFFNQIIILGNFDNVVLTPICMFLSLEGYTSGDNLCTYVYLHKFMSDMSE